jgi:tetratricopeptide (TPR) repeat protein
MNIDHPEDRNRLHFFYFLFFFIIGVYLLVSWPVAGYDSDLWYHLNGGRYTIEHRSIPTDSFFSFITPPRQWVDYYWLFQVVAYKAYSLFDYYGLIIIRALVFAATFTLVLRFLLRGNAGSRTSFYIKVIFALYFLLLFYRHLLVRPHMFSYLFIIAFLYILEVRPDRSFILPVLAILWVNLHGVEYPVIILICLAYILEFMAGRRKNRTSITSKDILYLLPVILSMLAVYATPHGVKLLGMSFIPKDYAFQAIHELNLMKISDVLTFEINVFSPSRQTIFNCILITASTLFIIRLFQKDLRISQCVLFIGGIALLTRSQRFMPEFALLALPVLKYERFMVSGNLAGGMTKKFLAACSVLLLIVSVLFLKNYFVNRPAYPFTNQKLPHGVSVFLKHIKVGGSVMNYPDNGGYLQWMLHPDYKIFSDLELPFLFTDEDHYIAVYTYHNKTVLAKVIQKYNPSFFVVPREKFDLFEDLIREYDHYAIVFFDDSEILYVNGSKLPDIAKQYRVRNMKSINNKQIDHLDKKKRDALLEKLLAYNSIYADGSLANQIIVMLYLREKEFQKAMPYADVIINNHPDMSSGYTLKGDSLVGLQKFDQAVRSYKSALRRARDISEPGIYKKLWFCYVKMRQHKEAYHALTKAIDIFSEATTYQDLYNLGATALNAGKKRESLRFFNFAYIKVPEDDIEWKKKIEEKLGIASS